MKAILRTVFLAIAIMALAVPASAGPFEDGLAAYQRGDYSTALQLWQPLAEQGDAGVQYNLGGMYADGQGVSQDFAKAVKWWRKAAEQGTFFSGRYLTPALIQNAGSIGEKVSEARWG